MREKILITGGAGFIGSNLLKILDPKRWEITVLDSLLAQVHPSRQWQAPENVAFIKGNICSRKAVRSSLVGVRYIVHLAAETGVGQSAYEMARHVKTNEYGTAVLLEEASQMKGSLKGVVIASSRAVYGEGLVHCPKCGPTQPLRRRICDLMAGHWEPLCPLCFLPVASLPAREEQPIGPTSIYGVTKVNQEQLLQQFSEMFGIPGVALRFQNVYGPGQSLSNPYTGILAVFSTRALSDKSIYIYEDGQESRDFVFVNDAVQAICLTLEGGFKKSFSVYNVGSGVATTVTKVANTLVKELNKNVTVAVSGQYRVGDIRHASANISKIQNDLNYSPRFSLEQGLKAFAEWVKTQPLPIDKYEKTVVELRDNGLLLESVKVESQ